MNLWMEGYAVTGNHATAKYLGNFPGDTLMEAYLNYIKETYKNEIPDYVSKDRPCIWGCSVYDNEVDARKSFG